ncbi:hypothetical protein AJ79_07861 [Helicocarpus griseus UAMH5409]|uniref:Uncharacterized protein n=1 Tax=Helicocarpus griseus UAMH5409 TaxID=1447875 RepID=A0A2B7WYG9_9EURO|nr:hypothetical protein AJ79_07861 [Helicocarpus griseus UAMH5409]
MIQTVVLITGANRGIGKGLLTAYLGRPNTTVIAACRDASAEKTKGLRSLPRGVGSDLILVPISLDIPESATNAVQQLQTQHNIKHIDIVVANAGICNHWSPLAEMEDSVLLAHLDVNTFGPLRLFRAAFSLLQASNQPKFVYISTSLASIAGLETSSSWTTAYGVSKVAGNYLVKKIDAEYGSLIAFSIDPGFVQTDMGNRGARANGLEKAPMTIHESVDGIVYQIETATKATTSGRFLRHNGESVPW